MLTLVKQPPVPLHRFSGDLSDTQHIIVGMDLTHRTLAYHILGELFPPSLVIGWRKSFVQIEMELCGSVGFQQSNDLWQEIENR